MNNVQVRDWQDQPISEAIDPAAWVDPRGAYMDDGGIAWIQLGSAGENQEKTGFCSDTELAEARRACRYIARKSPFAINGHENRISYVVGCGHMYNVAAKEGATVDAAHLISIRESVSRFQKSNRWQQRQAEIIRRYDRDGEVFIRKFRVNGQLIVRFVEPGQVLTPSEKAGDESATFGIKTKPDDVETVEEYYIDGKAVPANEIQHRKANVDSNVKRGVPLFWPVLEVLRQIPLVLRNMSLGSALQTSVAYVRTVKGGSSGVLGNMATASADFTRQNYSTNKTERFEEHRGGKIIAKSDAMEYDFPFANTRYDQYVNVIAANLRAVAALLVMPEFMLTSDASNANYSSTMVAEGPAVRNFERLQYLHIDFDRELIEEAVKIELGEEALDNVEIKIEPPTLATRDKLQEAQTFQVYKDMKVLSKQTITAAIGYDYEEEQGLIEEDEERNPEANLPPLLLPGDPGYDPASDPNAEPNNPPEPPQPDEDTNGDA